MTDPHPNLLLLQQLDPRDLTARPELFSPDVVFHYFNPHLPKLAGDHVGLAGLHAFFKQLGVLSEGSFEVEPVAATPVGDELVVTQTRNSLTLHSQPLTIDVVVVWRIVDGRITEIWDIPSAYTRSSSP